MKKVLKWIGFILILVLIYLMVNLFMYEASHSVVGMIAIIGIIAFLFWMEGHY